MFRHNTLIFKDPFLRFPKELTNKGLTNKDRLNENNNAYVCVPFVARSLFPAKLKARFML